MSNDDDGLWITCRRHGRGRCAVVCTHQVEVQTHPVGFVDNSAPGDLQAWCHACERLFVAEGRDDRRLPRLQPAGGRHGAGMTQLLVPGGPMAYSAPMASESGGVMAANAREGFRSEAFAKFALSAFGPSTIVGVGDDYGIDLICAVASRSGHGLRVGPGYAVQVKSDDGAPVVFRGDRAGRWLSGLDSPLLICRVCKSSARIRLYSASQINRALLEASVYGALGDEYRLIMDLPVTAERVLPERIPMGDPILDFTLPDLADSEKLDLYRLVLR